MACCVTTPNHYISQCRPSSVSSVVSLWVRSRNCGCLVTWFCYQVIAKPGNKTVAHSWPDPYQHWSATQEAWISKCNRINIFVVCNYPPMHQQSRFGQTTVTVGACVSNHGPQNTIRYAFFNVCQIGPRWTGGQWYLALINHKYISDKFIINNKNKLLSSFQGHHKIHGAVAWRWCHNGPHVVSNHQPHDCLLNRLFRRRSKKTSKLRVTGLCAGNSPGPVKSPHKWPVTRKMFPFHDVIMEFNIILISISRLPIWTLSGETQMC